MIDAADTKAGAKGDAALLVDLGGLRLDDEDA